MKKFYAFLAAAVALTCSAQVLLSGGLRLDQGSKPAQGVMTKADKAPAALGTLPIKPLEALSGQSGSVEAPQAGLPTIMVPAEGFANIEIEKRGALKAPMRVAQDTDDANWQVLGTGTYTDDCLNNILQGWSMYTWDVEIQENINTPGYYRVAAPYLLYPGGGSTSSSDADPYLYIHAEDPTRVYMMEDYVTGYNIGYGYHHLRDLAATALEAGYTADQVAEQGWFGSNIGGNITFPISTLQMLLPNYSSTWFTVNQTGGWKVTLPDAKDYWLTVKADLCAAGNIITYNVAAGADIASVKAVVMKGAYGFNDQNYSYAAENGEVVNIGANTVDVSAEEGRYTLFVAAFNADGEYIMGEGTYFYSLPPDNNDDWRSLGTTNYAEDIVRGSANWQNISEYEYMVEIQVSKDVPGLYRLVNPYGATCVFPNSHPQDHNHYMYIHAEDPDKVYISESVMGYDKGAGGMCVISKCKLAANYDIASNYGKLENSVITFPTGTLLLCEQNEQHGGWFQANRNGGFKLDIPYDEEAQWLRMDPVSYTDDCFNNIFASTFKENYTWEVECWYNKDIPGYYRLANPYITFPVNVNHSDVVDPYMYLHMENPEQVYFESFCTGLNLNYGNIFLSTKAWNSIADDGLGMGEVADLGLFGSFVDGVVSFPIRSVVMSLEKVSNGDWKEVNRNGALEIVFSDNSEDPVDPDPEDPTEEEWTSIGEATYTDECLSDIFSSIQSMTWKVACEESTVVPGFYRVANPYLTIPDESLRNYLTGGDEYLYVHTEDPTGVYMSTLDTGLDVGYGSMLLRDIASTAIEAGMSPADLADMGYLGTLSDGHITFPTGALQMLLPNYSSEWMTVNREGKWQLSLPGAPDYSIAVTAELCGDNNVIPLSITAGADVATIRYMILKGNYSFSEANYSYVSQNGSEIAAGDYNYTPAEGAGAYTIFVTALDADGNHVGSDGTFFYVIEDNDADWQSLGMGEYTDDIVSSAYSFTGVSSYTYEVEVQENVNTPGFYRIVNPYGAETMWTNFACDHNHYMYIHAEDPDKVYMDISPLGLTVSSAAGGFLAASYAGNFSGTTDADYGKLANREITFAARKVLSSQQRVGQGAWYYSNLNGNFKLVVPKYPNTIVWDQPLDELYPAGSIVEIYATSASGADVVFTVSTAENEGDEYVELDPEDANPVAMFDGRYLTLNREGYVSIAANCPESDTHAAAEPVVRAFRVGPTVGIEGIVNAAPAKVSYYNLQGVRIDRPAKGSVVIRVVGDKATKMVVK